MGNTHSGSTHSDNSNMSIYDQYLNEQKRIIAAQQQQINNLTKMSIM